VARWDESVQHFGGAGVRMEQHARLFLCARCRTQVVLCSHCDRGNRYCNRACWRQARDEAQRQAAQRYQRSWRGRIAHAQRAQRWLQRRAGQAATVLKSGADGGTHNVTHQGSPPVGAWAPLGACTHDSAAVAPADMAADMVTEVAAVITSPGASQDPAPAAAVPAATPCWTCRRCGQRQPSALRLGFLRHGLWQRWRHDHSP
jgi:hypothetical protein